MNSILIATDFSANASQAAVYGYRLASKLGADVTLAHAQIIPAEIPQAGLAAWANLPYDEIENDGWVELTRLKARLESLQLPAEIRPEIHYRQQNGALTQLLAGEPAGLVVMGTHGNDRLGTLLIGDHCRKAIETLHSPLLLVPADHRREQIGRLVFASDFTDPAKDLKALRWLVNFARPLGAAVSLVHICNRREHTAQFSDLAAGLLRELGQRTGYDRIDAQTVDHNGVEDGLQTAVKILKADILVIRHQPHGWAHELLLGDHSKKMAAIVQVPLLILQDQK